MTTWTEIASLDAPTAGAFDFPSLTLTGYTAVEIVCAGITVTTDGTVIVIQCYVGGSLVSGSVYKWGCMTVTPAPVSDADGNTTATGIIPHSNDANQGVGNAAGESFGGIIRFDEPLSTALYKKCRFECAMENQVSESLVVNGGGQMDDAGAIQGWKITGTSDLTAGKVRILGMA